MHLVQQLVSLVVLAPRPSGAQALAWRAAEQSVHGAARHAYKRRPSKAPHRAHMVALREQREVERERIAGSAIVVVQKDGVVPTGVKEPSRHAANTSEHFRNLQPRHRCSILLRVTSSTT